MPIKEYCTKSVITAQESQTVLDAAKQMRDKNVGCIVVLDSNKKPIGMVTDRDIAIKTVAEGKDSRSTVLKEIMSKPPFVLRENHGVFETTKIMCENGIRRIPVVDVQGNLSGIICLDDLIMMFGVEVANIGSAIAYGTSRAKDRTAPLVYKFTSEWEMQEQH